MANAFDPSLFNIDIIAISDQEVKYIREVTNPNIFEPSSNRFDKAGLFSTEIFGPVGSPARNTQLGYIDLKVKVLHPFVFQTLCTLNSKYEDILSGKKRAKLDRDKWDLVEDNSGETGYEFFMSVLPRIRFNDNGSNERKYKINFIKKYANEKFMSDKYLVLPAGLRDYRVDETGRPTEDEINTLYRRLLAVTALLKTIKVSKDNLYQVDPIRYKIQKSCNAIFDHFLQLLSPKSGFIQNKWSKRAIVNGTRNVLTPAPYKITKLNNVKMTSNHSVCGIYQYIKAIAPITMNRVKGMFINRFINPNSNTAFLVDPNTKKSTLANIKVNKRDEWLSMEGLNRIMNKMKQAELRFEPVTIDGYYLCMLYDNGESITLLYDTKDITPDMKPEWIRPITYIEMFYISIYEVKNKYPGFVTRYPVISLGGIFPCYIYVKTTYKARDVKVNIFGRTVDMDEYPILGEECMESTSMPNKNLSRSGADFDGDCCLGAVLCRFKKNWEQFHIMNNKKIKGHNMLTDKKQVIYKYGLLNLKEFPKGKLIKIKGNTEYYKVPKNIEILTIWNGETKWVKPESYSIHKNLNMLSVRTNRGNSVECSDDHSLVTVDENLNYVRSEAKKGMTVPKVNNIFNKLIDNKKTIYHIKSENVLFNLNKDFGYALGVVIGDGWVNKSERLNDVMVATTHNGTVDKLSEVFRLYGYKSKPYTISNEHYFDGHVCHSAKSTWAFKPFANICRKYIGLGAHNKHLPDFWLNTSIKFRWGLLSGLIDTDGTLIKISKVENNYAIKYCTVSERLAYEVIALANSLDMSAGLTIIQRPHKATKEYYISFRNRYSNLFKENLILFNKEKNKRLQLMRASIREQEMNITPHIPLKRLEELKNLLSKKEDTYMYSNVLDGIKKASFNNFGWWLQRYRFMETYKKYYNVLSKDNFWNKLYEMCLDENIEWEYIQSISKLEEVTEEYDLTTPPHCTFVLQNGIVVYDTVSLNVVYTEDAIKEINDLLNSNKYYLSPEGSIAYSADDDVISLVLKHMTDKPSNIDISKEERKEDISNLLDAVKE